MKKEDIMDRVLILLKKMVDKNTTEAKRIEASMELDNCMYFLYNEGRIYNESETKTQSCNQQS